MNRIATTQQAYKQATGLNQNPDKRGPKIRTVDDAFVEYDNAFRRNYREATQIQETLNLYTACKNWLQRKYEKSHMKHTVIGSAYQNTNLVNRRNMIRNTPPGGEHIGCQSEIRYAQDHNFGKGPALGGARRAIGWRIRQRATELDTLK